MNYTKQEVMQFINEEDVSFIRLAFCDVFGRQKNISIMPEELQRAFDYGIAIDASAVAGFGDEVHSDLFLHPDPSTLSAMPWRPEHGQVVRMYCSVTYPDGSLFENDTRSILIKAVETAEKAGYRFYFGSEMEFYLFKLDDYGENVKIPYDNAGYMDAAPYDKSENIRRDICLTLQEMGINPESCHHEEGPGQNEIDFRYSDALSAADDALTFRKVVQDIAMRNGLWASFSPKPFDDKPGNGFHINMSVKSLNGNEDISSPMIAGILDKIKDMTLFMNHTDESYKRLGCHKAPRYISWSSENRSQLIRIPAAQGEYKRMELRSPDPRANPYLAFALMIYAALYGIQNALPLEPASDINLYKADVNVLRSFRMLPQSKAEAAKIAASSEFLREFLPESIIKTYCE
ncbi:MAG: glutamine synthetase family protein [Clostridia bacterium]|nr:glutamine synthetase family protein [Clostridia bacterium]